MTTWSRLHPFIADDNDSGKPDSVLVLKGFANRDEILKFVRVLMDAGIFKPPAEHAPAVSQEPQ